MISQRSGLLRGNPAQACIWPDSPVGYPIVARFRLTSSCLPGREGPLFPDGSGQSYPGREGYPGWEKSLSPGHLLITVVYPGGVSARLTSGSGVPGSVQGGLPGPGVHRPPTPPGYTHPLLHHRVTDVNAAPRVTDVSLTARPPSDRQASSRASFDRQASLTPRR